MNFPIPKILALIPVFIGMGAVFSETSNSNNSQESFIPESININALKLTNDNEITGSRDVCKVYEVKKNPHKYKVDAIIREIKEKDKFLDGLNSSNKRFVDEVKGACLEQNRHFKSGDYTYVYIHQLRNKWMYSKDLQGRDWSKFLTGKPIDQNDKF